MDHYGVDSEHDYDPFWRRVVELDVPIAGHMSAAGLIDHVSPSNSLFSCGQFAATGEALAKSLLLGGILHRFPTLRVALLEGGVGVGVRLYADLASRFDKRGPTGIRRLDLRNVDTEELARLAQCHYPRLVGLSSERLLPALREDEAADNDFERSGVQSLEDLEAQFCGGLYWGCEADDPLVSAAFDQRVNACGATIRAFIGSDIGHWDVPSFDHPLREAFERLDQGLLTAEQFRAFTFTHVVRFYAGDDGDFFDDTAIDAAGARDVTVGS